MPEDSEEPEHFNKGATKTGLKKLKKLVNAVKRLMKDVKRLKRYSPYLFVLCENGEPAVYQILSRKIDTQADLLSDDEVV